MNKVAISSIDDFINFKIDMNYINRGGNKNIGGGLARNLNMNEFLGLVMPKLKGGYRDYKLKKNKKGGATDDFNLFKDIFSPLSQQTYTNTYNYNDLSFKGFDYPTAYNLSRSVF